MALKLDIKGLNDEILDKLKTQLDYACIAWRTEVLDHLKHPYFGEGENPHVEYFLRKKSKSIIGYLEVNTYVLADSYGTGSLMLTSNPGFQEYKSSKRWNPVRKGTSITGRPEGEYINTFGKKKYSHGTMEGRNIEGWTMITGYKIQPSAPSYAIQMAEQWLYKTYLPNAYKLAVREINFSKYLIES